MKSWWHKPALRYALLQGVGRHAGNDIAYALGDSRTNQNIQTSISYGVTGNGVAWCRSLSGQRPILPLANINGGSGESPATIRSTRYPTAKASSAKTLILLAGVNQGTSMAQDLADVTFMAQDFAASAGDRIALVFDEMPVDASAGKDATWKARQAALRDGIRALHRPGAGVYVVPSWRVATGGDDGDTPLANFYRAADGIHPALLGAFLLGKRLAQYELAQLLPGRDPYSGLSFAIGTTLDGANFAGATGNAISVASLAAGGATSSRMVVDGATTWAELTLNGTSGVSINKSVGSVPANITPGTTVVSSIIKVKLHAGLTNCRQVALNQIKQSGQDLGTNAGGDGRHPGSATEIGEIPVDADTYLTLWTPPITVAADATSCRWQVQITPERVSGVDQTMAGLVSFAFAGMVIESP